MTRPISTYEPRVAFAGASGLSVEQVARDFLSTREVVERCVEMMHVGMPSNEMCVLGLLENPLSFEAVNPSS